MFRLQTERLLIRDHVADDLATHHELLSDPGAMYYLPNVRTQTMDETVLSIGLAMAQVEHPRRKHYFFRVVDRQSKAHIGEIGYSVTKATPTGKLVDAGFFLRPSCWGKGYATEALRALLRHAFLESDVIRVSAGCLRENVRGQRVLEKCGMAQEAVLKEYSLHEGTLKDRLIYRLLRREWEALPPELRAEPHVITSNEK